MSLRGRSFLAEEQIFFVTTSVINHYRIFSQDIVSQILINAIKHYQSKYSFSVLSYVIMPSHFHSILLTTPQHATIIEIMREIKRYSAWHILSYLNKNRHDLAIIFEKNADGSDFSQKRKFWDDRYFDKVIRDESMFANTVKYIHENPVKAGLVKNQEDYKFSSARNYLLDDHSVLEVDTSYLHYKIT